MTKPKHGRRARHTAGSRGTFHEVRFLSAKPTQVIVMLVYLTSTVRSQGFSPSQRFDPTRTLWLCFAPHPPIGFWPPKLFPFSQQSRLSAFVALLSLVDRQTFWETHSVWGPCFRVRRPVFPHAKTELSSLLVRPRTMTVTSTVLVNRSKPFRKTSERP